MRFPIIAGVTAMVLFVAYFSPVIIKLKDVPLAIVVLGGFTLAALDLWESLKD